MGHNDPEELALKERGQKVIDTTAVLMGIRPEISRCGNAPRLNKLWRRAFGAKSYFAVPSPGTATWGGVKIGKSMHDNQEPHLRGDVRILRQPTGLLARRHAKLFSTLISTD